MAASVWMTPSIVRLLIDLIVRPSALTTPVVSVWSRPNGLPIARTFCPTRSDLRIPDGHRLKCGLRGLDLEHGEYHGPGSTPTTSPYIRYLSAKVTVIASAPYIT